MQKLYYIYGIKVVIETWYIWFHEHYFNENHIKPLAWILGFLINVTLIIYYI